MTDIRILIVDDVDLHCRIIKEQLIKTFPDVTTCVSVNEAMSLMITADDNGAPFDIAIIDYLMPIKTGLDLGQEILDSDLSKKPYRIGCSSSDQPVLIQQFMDLGFSAFLKKPCSATDLVQTIQNLIGGGKAQKEQSSALDNVKFKNVRVLLAEDNSANKKAASHMLQTMGCEVAYAENGKVAVQKALNETYDLILMDLNMPVMDGYQAAKILSMYIDEGAVQKTPIIAATDTLSHEEMTKYKMAGMDDHLSKSATHADYQQILSKWLAPKNDNSRADNIAICRDTAMTDAGINCVMFNEMRDLLGDAFEDFINSYVQTSNDYIENIKKAIKDQDYEALRQATHPLKSSSRQVGADHVSKIAASMEEMSIRQNSFVEIMHLFETLSPAHGNVTRLLQNK